MNNWKKMFQDILKDGFSVSSAICTNKVIITKFVNRDENLNLYLLQNISDKNFTGYVYEDFRGELSGYKVNTIMDIWRKENGNL